MAGAVPRFEDSAGYERFMGQWSRAAGAAFLRWLTPPEQASWLDVGCGTGAFTQLILSLSSPAAVWAVNPTEAQIRYARARCLGGSAKMLVADAQALPFPDSTFDIVSSALVINFIADRSRAFSEMRRIAVPGALVAGYVWDFASERSPSWPLRTAMREMGMKIPPIPGTEDSTLEALVTSLADAGLKEIAATSLDVNVSLPNFLEFWETQTSSYSPTTEMIRDRTAQDRAKLRAAVRAKLTVAASGEVRYSARANAIQARVPFTC